MVVYALRTIDDRVVVFFILTSVVSIDVSESVYPDRPAPEYGGNSVPAIMQCEMSIHGCFTGKVQYAQPALVVDPEP